MQELRQEDIARYEAFVYYVVPCSKRMRWGGEIRKAYEGNDKVISSLRYERRKSNAPPDPEGALLYIRLIRLLSH